MNAIILYISRLCNEVSTRTVQSTLKKMTTQAEQISKCVRLCQEHFGGAWHRVTESEAITSAVKPVRYDACDNTLKSKILFMIYYLSFKN